MKTQKDGLAEFFELLSKSQKYSRVIKRRHKELLVDNFHRTGKTINCHLVIENLISSELESLGIITKKDLTRARFSFFHKLALLPKSQKTYSHLIRGIQELNQIRNQISHNLQFKFEDHPMKEIRTVLESQITSKYKNLNSEDAILAFADICLTHFSYRDPQVKQLFAEFAVKYPNMKTLLQGFL